MNPHLLCFGQAEKELVNDMGRRQIMLMLGGPYVNNFQYDG